MSSTISHPQSESEWEKQDDIELSPEYLITDLETLKVVADPLRIQLLELMWKPITVKKIARKLDMTTTRLYYHVNQLEKYGLIRVVATRLVSGIVEKQYQVVARSIRVERSVLDVHNAESEASLLQIMSSLFDQAISDIKQGIAAGVIPLNPEKKYQSAQVTQSAIIQLDAEQAEAFYERFRELVNDFKAQQKEDIDPNLPAYRITLAWYPVDISQHTQED